MALIGAAALALHLPMEWRTTADIDLVVAISVADLTELSKLPGWTRDANHQQRWVAPNGVLVSPPNRLLIKESKRIVPMTSTLSPRRPALRVEPPPALAVAPRRIVHALMPLDLLKRRRRELDLRERVHPRDDGERVGAHRDAGLGELASEPTSELVACVAIDGPCARERRAQPEEWRHDASPLFSPARYLSSESRNGWYTGSTRMTDREEDGRRITEVLEIPGGLAYGATFEEAMREAKARAFAVVADRACQPDIDSVDFASEHLVVD